MSRTLRNCLACLLLLAAPLATAPLAAEPPPRIIAIGDVHGAYESLVALLRRAGLVDAQLGWSGGTTRLVMLGDVLDRGDGSRAALELLMRLHEQAPRSGGEAELLLGNHEVMNLVGDLRYVDAAQFAAYQAEEPPGEREAAWQRYRTAAGGDEATAATAFARRYPPGYFGHRALFAARGRFGAWLLQRPVIVQRDRTLFVHGGLPPWLDGKDLADINRAHGAALGEYLQAVEALAAAGLVHPEDGQDEQLAIAARIAADSRQPAAAIAAARRLQAAAQARELGPEAVNWYRGTAACSAAIERGRLDKLLARFGADRVVIGHTPTTAGRLLARFDGRVIRADTGMLTAYYGGRAAALLVDGTAASGLAADGEPVPIEPQPRAVGVQLAGRDDAALETLLGQAPVVARAASGDGTTTVTLEQDGRRVTALFRPAPRGSTSLPEVAAYRLDRLLELDLVPVAVRREVEGRVGSLQLATDTLLTEERRAREGAAEAWCPLPDQYQSMYAFDALAANEGRARDAIGYRADSLQLVLTGNAALFGTRRDLPAYLRSAPIAIPPYLAAGLARLDAPLLEQHLGDVLDARQRAAILARRDRLLARR